MEVRLLGPVELWDAGRQVPLGPRQQRCVLAVLAMTPRQPVPADLLIDRVWGERPPRNVRNALYTNLSRLRGTLGRAAGRLRRDDTGYLLDVDDQQVDLLQARRLAAEGRGLAGARPDAAERAVEQLRAAHALWRGTPLGGLTGDWADRARHALTQELLAIATDRFELELAAGRCAEAVGPLSALHADHPLAEAVAGLLMRALSRGGRQSEALQVYALTRAQLAAELGVEPGPALQRLHRQIVRGDPEPPAGQPAPVPPPPAQPPALPPPAQLPPDVAAFVGRHRELRQLDDLRDSRGDATSVVIVAITGTGGVGKTALAVHWAHRLRDRFPDGQLYVNLRGFTPRGSPMEPAEAVRGFLAALQVPAEQLPGSLDAQVGRYRSLLAGRRVVVLLDNARDTTQVRPLLPGTAGCLVIVTSRNQLAGLVVAEGAELLTLGRLPGVEAWQLLAGRVGDHRLASEPGPVQEIIARCAGLPLALAIVGARAAAHPGFALAELADELAGVDDGLDAFDGADPVTGLRAVFSWSYRTLAPPAARLFRVLGLHPGPDLSGPAVASLAGIPAARAGRLLADLTRAHLLSEHRPGRYTLHDLLRTYASELVRALDPPERRSAARHRLLDHYLHTAHAAARLLIPGRGPLQLEPAGAGVTPENLTSERQAWAWFAREHQALLAAIDHAADHGFDTHAWQLAWAVEDFLDRQGHWRDLAAAERLVLGAVTQLGDRGAQAHTHRGLARAYLRLGRLGEAQDHLRHALDRYRELGDRLGEAHSTRNLALVLESLGRHQEALDHARQALRLYPRAGHESARARALNSVGWCHAMLGDYRQAVRCCWRALSVQERIGDRWGQAGTWHSLGYAHHRLGEHQPAITCYQRAARLHGELGNRYSEARALQDLGDALRAAHAPPGGHPADREDLDAAAREAWQRALQILSSLDHPDAERVRERLGQLGGPVGQ